MIRRKPLLSAVRRRTRAPAAAPVRRRGVRRSVAGALILPAVVGGFALQAWGGREGEQMFHEVVSRIATQGLDSLTDAQLYEKAARGLLAEIGDPYADLFSPEQLAAFSREALRNSYTGVGMQITLVRDTATVTRVFAGSPAAEAGVRPGDRVVRVGTEGVTGIPLEQVTQRLLGTPGTRVEVEYHRPRVGPVQHTFVRERVKLPSVGYAVMLEEGIGYVPLDGFNDTSGEEVLRALVDLRKRGATSYVLDLRGNTGGSLDQAVRIAGLFLRPGQQVLRADFRGAPDETYEARTQPVIPDAPLVVLTDEESASASEIVAGALQDHDRAVVIGATSFGKGLVQDIFQLEGGWALKLTTGRWYTPSGRTIQRERRINAQGRLEEVPRDSLAERPGVVNEVLQEMAVDLGLEARPDFRSAPERRDDLLRRLERRGMRVDPEKYRAGSTLVDRLLEDRVLQFAYGDSASFRRTVPRDRQLQSAIEVLRGARTQNAALARATARPAAPRTRS
jgi:carboxyl-terminal processing protease